MIESFGVDRKNVAKWAGIAGASFSLAQCFTAVLWGRASDRFGRKPTILVALFCTMTACLVWGMSKNLPMAIAARALAGACNGNGNFRSQVEAPLANTFSWYHSDDGSRDGPSKRASTKGVLDYAIGVDDRLHLRPLIRRNVCQTYGELALVIREQQILRQVPLSSSQHGGCMSLHSWAINWCLVSRGMLSIPFTLPC